MSAFIPTTDRQIQLVEDIKRLHARHKERSAVVQFSERDQDYFKINLKVLMERLQETTETALSFDEKTGAIQFAEKGTNITGVLRKYGYSQHYKGEGPYGAYTSWKHPKGHQVVQYHKTAYDQSRWEHEDNSGKVTNGDHHSELDKHLAKIHK